MREAEGIEVGAVDATAWDEAMSRFGALQNKPAQKKTNPLASLSLHERRLLPPEARDRKSQG